jgi:hypothetical protein
MTDLKAAQDRLEKALVRLETAVARPRGNGAADDALKGELDAARRHCAALEGRTGEVSQRLDDAIARIRTVLEG